MPTKLEANASFRKPRFVFLVLALALIFSVVCVGGVSAWSADTTWGQNYNDENVLEFYIEDAGDLAQFAIMVNSGNDFSGRKVILNNNIDLQNQEWKPIGDSSSNPFRGTFDGAGHYIDNLQIVFDQNTKVGLFGYVDLGVIYNLQIIKVKFLMGKGHGKGATLGSIVGSLNDGYIKDCSVTGQAEFNTQTGGPTHYTIGGLIGEITVTDKSEDYIEENIGDYLQGHCFVTTLLTDYNKDWGLLVGNPMIGKYDSSDSSSTDDDNSAIYTVEYYTMQTNGDSPGSITKTYIGIVGEDAGVEPASDGYFISSQTPAPGTDGVKVKSDGSLVVKVYYGILVSYKIEIPSTLVIKTDTKTGTLPITATELWILDYGRVDVSVSSEYDFNMAYQGKPEGPFVKYELRLDNSIINENSVAATFSRGSSKPGLLDTPRTVSLTAELTGHPPYVGSYNDILTFTAEYKESAPANR